jgi:2-methylisocitrate lyase-like PEP mutase family enzyme
LAALAGGVSLPLTADFEAGFGLDPEGVAESVTLATATGVAGLSIEDRDMGGAGLYDTRTAVERLRAARAAIDQTGEGVVLVARTEGLLLDPAAMSPAIKRLVAFADAGRECLCAPGVRGRVDIAALVRAVAPKPVNVAMMRPGLSLGELVDLGVRRVSIGGPLARVVWAAVVRAARELKNGRFDALSAGIPAVALDAVSARSVLNNARHEARPHYSCRP